MKNEGSANIIKSNRVKLQGSCRVDIGQAGSAQTRANKPKGEPAAVSTARLLEKHQEYAVIELVCSCGQKSRIRCDYAQAPNVDEQATAKPEQ